MLTRSTRESFVPLPDGEAVAFDVFAANARHQTPLSIAEARASDGVTALVRAAANAGG